MIVCVLSRKAAAVRGRPDGKEGRSRGTVFL